MKSRSMFLVFLVLVAIGISFIVGLFNKQSNIYTAKILSYEINDSHIEYPKITGLKDKEKQESINKVLEEQVLYGAKTYKGETFVDFSEPNYYYKYKTSIGLINNKIASFLYTFQGSAIVAPKDELKGHTEREYGITIDMKTGEEIELWDFMELDERLINSNDGTNIETDYNSEKLPEFHNFKDAFKIYDSEEEWDPYHIHSAEYIIEYLKKSYETRWYIDENKNIVFFYDDNCVKIPYINISDAIYPRYLEMLE